MPQERIIVEIDKDIEEIIPDFLKHRNEEINILKTALANRNFTEIQSIGHKVSGNAGSYGFDQLGTYGAALEKLAIEQNKNGINEQISNFENYLTSIEIKYV